MLTEIHPKLPMRSKSITRDFYINMLNFEEWGTTGYANYLMLKRDNIQIHFFEFKELNPLENYGQVYIRTDDIESRHRSIRDQGVEIHPHGQLELKPWGQREFSLLDPDNNLLTFGQGV